jgi:putative MFS transporter
MWAPALFVLQLGVTPAQAAHLYIWVTVAVTLGRVIFSFLSETIGRRLAGALSGFGAAIAILLAGILHNALLGSVSVLWLMIVVAGFFLDGGGAVLGPYMAEVWPIRLRTTGMGSAYGFGGLGKLLGPIGLTLIAGTSNVMNPEATLKAIGPAFSYFAACAALSGCAFLFFGLETGGATLTALDARLEKCSGGSIAPRP